MLKILKVKKFQVTEISQLGTENNDTTHTCMQIQDFPGGPVVKNLPANRGDMGSIPGPEIPHATEQQSLSATTTDSLHPKAHTLKQEKPEQ